MITGQWESRKVQVDGKELTPYRSQKLFNHSPDGFNWSYGGSGPAQLALGLLLQFGATDEEAVRWHQTFKFQVIAALPAEDFQLPSEVVTQWIEARRSEAKS